MDDTALLDEAILRVLEGVSFVEIAAREAVENTALIAAI